jgi:hypothetical protein
VDSVVAEEVVDFLGEAEPQGAVASEVRYDTFAVTILMLIFH